MVNYFIYAKDFSFSTYDEYFYHTNGLETLKQFKSDVKKINDELSKNGKSTESQIIYLHWGHECVKVSEDTAVRTYLKRQASGNDTLPETIIKWLKENINMDSDKDHIKLMYIITDGLIEGSSLNKCLSLNENMQYENVVFHGLHRDVSKIDLSVAASFLKGRCTIYRNNELLDETNISEEFNYDKITVENFITEKNDLKSYIKLKYINTFKSNNAALQEIEKLKKLRNRLLKEVSSMSPMCNSNLDTKDKNTFIQVFKNTNWYRMLNNASQDIKVDIEKSISTLINYIVSDKKSYAFDALKFDTNFNKDVDEEPIVDVNFTAEQEIEFPDIILNDDKGIPVILLTELNLLEKLIFHTAETSAEVSPASFSKFKSTMECPLFLLNDPDISDSIGYFYTLNVYKQLLEQTTRTEPRTRKPYHGGLVLLDTVEFDKYNDYILSATYFNFKKVYYNIGLFYYVLWKNCEKKEWMDKNVIEQFKKYVMRRISTTVCKVGLSSLPLDPPDRTSLLTALWYCVELSSDIFKEDPQNFMHERMRMYYGIAPFMIEILKYFNYNLDLKSIEKRSDIIRHVMTLKKIPKDRDKVYYLLEKIFKSVHGFLVCEIENPCNLKKLNYLKFNHKGMLCEDVVEEKVNLNDFVHIMYHVNSSKAEILLCDKTYRPFFMIDQNNSFYTALYKNDKKVIIVNDDENKIKISHDAIDSLEFDKVLSFYNLFINCVKHSGKYPTFSEYIEYVLKKKKFKEDLITIFPSHFYTRMEEVFSNYQNIVNNVNVDAFIKVCNSYISRVERIKAEGVRIFDSDNEINEFLHNEELKVNLIKPKTS